MQGRARNLELFGDLPQPRARASQPVGQRRVVTGEQQVERGAWIRDEWVPGVLAAFLDVEEPVTQPDAEHLGVDPMTDRQVDVVPLVQRGEASGDDRALLVQRGRAQVVEAAVEAVVAKRTREHRLPDQNVLDRCGGEFLECLECLDSLDRVMAPP